MQRTLLVFAVLSAASLASANEADFRVESFESRSFAQRETRIEHFPYGAALHAGWQRPEPGSARETPLIIYGAPHPYPYSRQGLGRRGRNPFGGRLAPLPPPVLPLPAP